MTSRAEKTSSNARLLDRSIYHAILAERFKNHEVRRLVRLLDREVLPDLRERLAGRLQNIATRGFDTGPKTTARLRYLFRDLRELFSGLVQTMHRETEAAAVDFASAQAAALARDIKREVGALVSVATPSAGTIRQAVTQRPFDGFLLKERWEKRGRAFREAVEAQVRIGLVQSETPEQIISRVREVWPAQRRHVGATVRAAVSHAQNQGRQATYEENRRLLRGVMWVATLDISTCFPAGTKVFSRGGWKPIEAICAGDEVLSSANLWRRVSRRGSRRYSGEMVALAAGNRAVISTPDHPFLALRDGTQAWVRASDIEVGNLVAVVARSRTESRPTGTDGSKPDTAVLAAGFHWAPVSSSVVYIHSNLEVFDLTVEGEHSFVAEGFAVHNCPVCGELDGQVFDPEEGPRPPAHFGCRCTTAPVLRSAADLGGTRASMDGQVPDATTFAEWIERQSAERQDLVFGRGRARLFRAGRLELADMVDAAGNVIPLSDLVAAGRQ